LAAFVACKSAVVVTPVVVADGEKEQLFHRAAVGGAMVFLRFYG
jgi:hypothetical protein